MGMLSGDWKCSPSSTIELEKPEIKDDCCISLPHLPSTQEYAHMCVHSLLAGLFLPFSDKGFHGFQLHTNEKSKDFSNLPLANKK